MKKITWILFSLVLIAGCGETQGNDNECPGPNCAGCPGPSCGSISDKADSFSGLNYNAGSTVLYEVQVRSANACDPGVGADWQQSACAAKIAPAISYYGEGCGELDKLHAIKLGTLDDMMEDTADYRAGITLKYVKERVGAKMVWFMPLFPNNDRFNLPDACDNLGSPYAVRDYLHASGKLSRACIQDQRDEYSSEPCWGTDELQALIDDAHSRGLKVMLDIALNHFGHNYLMYDTLEHTPIRERIARGENLDSLWDFAGTEESASLAPEVLDTPEKLQQLIQNDSWHADQLAQLQQRCPDLKDQELVKAYNMWRVAFDWERNGFPCDKILLEYTVPGFYLGANHWDPSTGLGDNFTNNWRDVKFLYHQRTNTAHAWEFVRNREYLFRIMNYWVSKGVDGFRLDHTTDGDSGMSPDEWTYLIGKVNHYAKRRGQARPIYMAEEFGDQMGMNGVVDMMTEGYVGDMNGRGGRTKDASHVEKVISNSDRFNGKTYVMTSLETHDEHRLLDGTGFNIWTGAGFWGIGATTWSTPMLMMGQEFGEPWGIAFRKSDYIRGRFVGTQNYNEGGDSLIDFYRKMVTSRLDGRNRALMAAPRHFLRTKDGNSVDSRIFAMAKWSGDGNVVFVFHNLWEKDVTQTYFIPPEIGDALWIQNSRDYRLVNILSGEQMGPCHSGADLKWQLYVSMPASERLQWLRLEACN